MGTFSLKPPEHIVPPLITLHLDGKVLGGTFSPDGKFVLTGGDDATAELWNASTGEPRFQLRGHQSSAFSVSFSSDGNSILTASNEGTARVCGIPTLGNSSLRCAT